ncbi:MAG: selenide, water dikinase SelD [Alphaproteobacteria bacterium]|nr:selenide, water dikinase SelD [Alphaproteobacteria bacterium]
MLAQSEPIKKNIILVGGGHSHVYVLKRYGMYPQPGVRLTLISKDVLIPYSGMVPGLISQTYQHSEGHIDLRRLASFANARLIHSSATKLDLLKKLVHVTGRPPMKYDILSLDIGSIPSVPDISGAEHALPVKPLDKFIAEQSKISDEIMNKKDSYNIVIVGGGAGGVELSMSLDQQLRRNNSSLKENPNHLTITIVESKSTLLPDFNPAARKKILKNITEHKIISLTNTRVNIINSNSVELSTGEILSADKTILVTNAKPPNWLSNTGLALDVNGFVRIDDYLRSMSHPEIYATGDIASMENYNLPKSGVYAVRQGPVLAENLRREFKEKNPKPYRPQKKVLALITTGNNSAVAARGSLAVSGKWVRRWKEKIDRRWIAKYQTLPEMAGHKNASTNISDIEKMRCGGCGAKVPASILNRVLERIPIQKKEGLAQGIDTPDDAAVIIPPLNKALIQTVDQFRSFTDDPYLFSRIATNHCLGDIFAMGAEPHSALAAIILPHDSEEIIAEDLYQLLAGATETLSEAGAVLAGGHTGEGAELAFGLTVNGYADPTKLLRKSGLNPGDILILTKPLGTGVLFAADMQAKTRANWIDAAFISMLRSVGPCVPILQNYGTSACTDVTGFGLMGHLIEMLRASNVEASINLDSLPLLSGAQELSLLGFESSLKQANENSVKNNYQATEHYAYPLMFDPQTAGGLLFGVPQKNAEQCIIELRKSTAPDATIIGSVSKNSTNPNLVNFI